MRIGSARDIPLAVGRVIILRHHETFNSFPRGESRPLMNGAAPEIPYPSLTLHPLAKKFKTFLIDLLVRWIINTRPFWPRRPRALCNQKTIDSLSFSPSSQYGIMVWGGGVVIKNHPKTLFVLGRQLFFRKYIIILSRTLAVSFRLFGIRFAVGTGVPTSELCR